jgi:hypothetical protein
MIVRARSLSAPFTLLQYSRAHTQRERTDGRWGGWGSILAVPPCRAGSEKLVDPQPSSPSHRSILFQIIGNPIFVFRPKYLEA